MTEAIALFLAGVAITGAGWALRQVHTLAVDVAVLKTTGRSIDLLRDDMRAMEARIVSRIDRMEARNGGVSET